LGSSFEPNQLKEEDPPSLSKYKIQNFHHDDFDDCPADPNSTGVARHQWDRSGFCNDVECDNDRRNRPGSFNSPSELVHLLSCWDDGELVGAREVPTDDKLKMP